MAIKRRRTLQSIDDNYPWNWIIYSTPILSGGVISPCQIVFVGVGRSSSSLIDRIPEESITIANCKLKLKKFIHYSQIMMQSLLLRPSIIRLNHQQYIQHTSSRLSSTVGICNSTVESSSCNRQPKFRFFSSSEESSSSSESSASAGPSSGGESRLHSTE